MQKKKGITLIALIITIIVMLILVGVTISIALNGRLFETAKQASKNTENEKEQELDLSEGKVYIDDEWYNSIEDYINQPEVPENLKKYILGENLTGRKWNEIFIHNKFVDDPTTAENEKQEIEWIGLGGYVKYNETIYYIEGENGYTTGIRTIYSPTGREGQDLGEITENEKYNGWTILYDYGDKVEAISPYVSDGELTLGSDDNIDEAINSYNNAITLINDYVKSNTTTFNGKPITYYTQDGTVKGVRSVGAGEDLTKEEDTYIYEWKAYNKRIKKADESWFRDWCRMHCFECFYDDVDLYWVASRREYSYIDNVDLWVGMWSFRGNLESLFCCYISIWCDETDEGYDVYEEQIR